MSDLPINHPCDAGYPIRATLSHQLIRSFMVELLKIENPPRESLQIPTPGLTDRPIRDTGSPTSLLFASAAGRGAALSGAAPAFFFGKEVRLKTILCIDGFNLSWNQLFDAQFLTPLTDTHGTFSKPPSW